MEISLLALIGIGLATMFFGYFFGLFEGRGQGYKKRKNEVASDPALRAALQPTMPPAPAAPAPPPEIRVQPQGKSLLRLSQDDNQEPCLELDGQRVDTVQMQPQQRRRLIDLMVVMRPWIEAGPVARPPQPAAPAPEAAPAPAPASQPVAPARATGPLAAPSQPPAEPVSAPTTMIGQIDSILQAKIAGTPLAARGIRLVESLQGGAMVIVGLQHYAGVGDVPDPEVQSVIRAAIAEWENKYTPS
jgi:hypothetical protein